MTACFFCHTLELKVFLEFLSFGFKLLLYRSIGFISCVKPSDAKNSVCNGTNNELEHTKAITVNKLNDGGQSI